MQFWVLVQPSLSGVRYYMRGLDDEGNVANYVETEQLIFYNGHKSSFIQV